MKLRAIEVKDLEQIRQWRQGKGYMLRTDTDITELSQKEWYENIVSNRNNKMKFWAIDDDGLIGYCSLDCDYVNGRAELGLLIGDEFQKKGYGLKAVELLIGKAFNELRMHSVYFECYECNPAIKFWYKVAKEYEATTSLLKSTKFYNGQYYGSLYGVIINER
jgi:RimJ/RimL family protein N-acetyltransferase